MILAIGTGMAVLWWAGLALVVLVVVPVVLFLAREIIVALREIQLYAEDIRHHGGGIATALEPVGELERTRALATDVGDQVGRIGSSLGRVLDGGRPR